MTNIIPFLSQHHPFSSLVWLPRRYGGANLAKTVVFPDLLPSGLLATFGHPVASKPTLHQTSLFPKDLVEGLLLKALGLTHLGLHLQEYRLSTCKDLAQALAL